MESGYLSFQIETPLGIAELQDRNMKAWAFNGTPIYSGPIDDAPQEWIDALLAIEAIRRI